MAEEKKEAIAAVDEATAGNAAAEPAEETQNTAIPDPPTLVRFAKPYTFEGKTYTEIDLSGLENITAKDMVNAESWLTKRGVVSALPEMTFEYVSFIASVVSGQPIEFFKGLSPKNAIRVKNKVTSFFYGQD